MCARTGVPIDVARPASWPSNTMTKPRAPVFPASFDAPCDGKQGAGVVLEALHGSGPAAATLRSEARTRDASGGFRRARAGLCRNEKTGARIHMPNTSLQEIYPKICGTSKSGFGKRTVPLSCGRRRRQRRRSSLPATCRSCTACSDRMLSASRISPSATMRNASTSGTRLIARSSVDSGSASPWVRSQAK